MTKETKQTEPPERPRVVERIIEKASKIIKEEPYYNNTPTDVIEHLIKKDSSQQHNECKIKNEYIKNCPAISHEIKL